MATVPVKEIYVGSTLVFPVPFDLVNTVTPEAIAGFDGSTVLLTATVTTAYTPVTYLWRKRAADTDPWIIIEGEVASTYSYPLIAAENGWSVSCQAKDKFGRQKGDWSLVTVYPAVTATIAPTSAAGFSGTVVAFTATPGGGDGVYTYQWNVDGAPVSGQTAATYSHTIAAAATVTCTVTSAGSAVTSAGAAITMYPALTSTLAPTSFTGIEGTAVTFTITPGGGSGAYQYEFWLWDGANWTQLQAPSATPTYTYTAVLAHNGFSIMGRVHDSGTYADSVHSPLAISPASPYADYYDEYAYQLVRPHTSRNLWFGHSDYDPATQWLNNEYALPTGNTQQILVATTGADTVVGQVDGGFNTRFPDAITTGKNTSPANGTRWAGGSGNAADDLNVTSFSSFMGWNDSVTATARATTGNVIGWRAASAGGTPYHSGFGGGPSAFDYPFGGSIMATINAETETSVTYGSPVNAVGVNIPYHMGWSLDGVTPLFMFYLNGVAYQYLFGEILSVAPEWPASCEVMGYSGSQTSLYNVNSGCRMTRLCSYIHHVVTAEQAAELWRRWSTPAATYEALMQQHGFIPKTQRTVAEMGIVQADALTWVHKNTLESYDIVDAPSWLIDYWEGNAYRAPAWRERYNLTTGEWVFELVEGDNNNLVLQKYDPLSKGGIPPELRNRGWLSSNPNFSE